MGEDGTAGARGRSYGPAAGLYERARPGYPPAVVAWLLGDRRQRVAELGAGTGKFTRALVAAGHTVVAVEPDDLMGAQLRAAVPGVQLLAGRAEAIPLGDACVDAVVAAESYHWFDPAAAHPEIARVVRPGGVFGAVWNVRDEAVPWVAELGAIIGSEAGFPPPRPVLDGFGEITEVRLAHAAAMDADRLVALAATRSAYLAASSVRRAELEGGVRALARSLPPAFELPYVTVAFRAVRSGSGG